MKTEIELVNELLAECPSLMQAVQRDVRCIHELGKFLMMKQERDLVRESECRSREEEAVSAVLARETSIYGLEAIVKEVDQHFEDPEYEDDGGVQVVIPRRVVDLVRGVGTRIVAAETECALKAGEDHVPLADYYLQGRKVVNVDSRPGSAFGILRDMQRGIGDIREGVQRLYDQGKVSKRTMFDIANVDFPSTPPPIAVPTPPEKKGTTLTSSESRSLIGKLLGAGKTKG